jgi:hypothetical protein
MREARRISELKGILNMENVNMDKFWGRRNRLMFMDADDIAKREATLVTTQPDSNVSYITTLHSK